MTSPLASSLIFAIRIYRRLAARLPRTRRCLYRESCSHHVERVAKQHGFARAFAAMRGRFRVCRPGYSFEHDGTAWWVVGVDGTTILSETASDAVWQEARACRVPVDRFAG